jgi:hypothetical protein
MDFGKDKIPVNDDEYSRVFRENFHHFQALQRLSNKVTGCGSYLVGIENLDYDPETYEKQKALYDYSKGKDRILEVGLYAGHSALIMLLANQENEDFRLVSIDVCHFGFTEKCADYLRKEFYPRFFFLKDNSLNVLPVIGMSFNLIHLDGDHGGDYASKETKLILENNHLKRVILVYDDKDAHGVQKAIETYKDKMKPLQISKCKWANAVYQLL